LIHLAIDATQINKTSTGIGNVTQSLVSGLQEYAPDSLSIQYLVQKNVPEQLKNNNYYLVKKWEKFIKFSLPKVDIWHSTYQHFRYVRKTDRTKHIITIHDLNFIYEKNAKKAAYHLRRMQNKIDAADVIVAISKFVADDIKKNLNLNGKRLEVIYNPVNTLKIDEQIKKPSFHMADKPFFFALSGIRPKKNFHVLIDMMKNLPDHHLYICGSFDNKQYLEQLHNNIVDAKISNVSITGPISTDDKIWLYQHMEAFLCPSLFEGFGLPVVEAMQFGKPVFTSNMTSLPEIGGGFSTIWQNFGSDYMADTVKTGLRNFPLDPARKIAMQEYAGSFSIENHARAYINLYQETAKNSG
jgi:glycosyltransferase involved in cell wall biosynthesis